MSEVLSPKGSCSTKCILRLLVYRPVGAGAVNITRGDLERLQPGKYLNDTLIEFGLKYVLTTYQVSLIQSSHPQVMAQ